MNPQRDLVIKLMILALLLLMPGSVSALSSYTLPLFTHNTNAPGPSAKITKMEQALLERIDAATTSLDLSIYGFSRATVRDAIIAAHERGVSIRVVADDDAYEDPEYNPHFVALEEAGLSIVNDARSSTMHNKFIIIDGQVVWTGSTNLTDTGFSFHHNNSVVFTSTLIADIFTTEFNEMFVERKFGTHKSDNTTHNVDYNGIPLEIYFSPSDGALDEVIAEVNAASESIYFSIFYSTDDTLRDALIARKQAGVTISGVWDKLGAGNFASDDEELCQAGISIKIEDYGGKMHNKFMVIDVDGSSPRVVTGSMNWTGSGANANDENTVIIHDDVTAQAYLAAFQELYDALDLTTLCLKTFLPIVLRAGASP
ncbi:MAG: phospholipase D-like domain-containing protein [Anaerolineales bacterium]|jgi:phosphatidylserine/phosphatidylglycerophosphate/cardiolipin synthase-like enzyme